MKANQAIFQNLFRKNRDNFLKLAFLKSIYENGFYNKLSVYYKYLFDKKENFKDTIDCWKYFSSDIYLLVLFALRQIMGSFWSFYLDEFGININLAQESRINLITHSFSPLTNDEGKKIENNPGVKNKYVNKLFTDLENLSVGIVEKGVRKIIIINIEINYFF